MREILYAILSFMKTAQWIKKNVLWEHSLCLNTVVTQCFNCIEEELKKIIREEGTCYRQRKHTCKSTEE